MQKTNNNNKNSKNLWQLHKMTSASLINNNVVRIKWVHVWRRKKKWISWQTNSKVTRMDAVLGWCVVCVCICWLLHYCVCEIEKGGEWACARARQLRKNFVCSSLMFVDVQSVCNDITFISLLLFHFFSSSFSLLTLNKVNGA